MSKMVFNLRLGLIGLRSWLVGKWLDDLCARIRVLNLVADEDREAIAIGCGEELAAVKAALAALHDRLAVLRAELPPRRLAAA